MLYLAGAVVQSVTVDCATLPVLDLHEAGTFGGAAVLEGLAGGGPALGWRLKRAHRSLTVSHSNVVLCLANGCWPLSQL